MQDLFYFIIPLIRDWAKNLFSLKTHNHSADYEPKNANIQAHISDSNNPHSVNKSQVGLGNVTNDAQVKKAASSTDGNIPTWNGTTGDSLGAGYGVETTLTNDPTKIPTSAAVQTALDNVSAGVGNSGALPPLHTLDDLKALDTTDAQAYKDAVLCNVESVGLYRLDRDSTATADDNLIVAPTAGVGRWYKMNPSTDDHNSQSGKQGGAPNEYYHLSADQAAAAAGSHGTPSGANPFMTLDDPKLSKLAADGTFDEANLTITEARKTALTNLLNA